MNGLSAAKPVSLSYAHTFTLDRDPNLPPPGRTTHLPISSQGSPGPASSSPTKMRNTPPRSSAEHIISDYLSISPQDEPEGEDEEDPEFAGMEVIGASQWEREVPSFKKRRSSSREMLVEETEHVDHLGDDAEQWGGGEERFATRSPIAGPSSQPMRTPVYSLTHTSSDMPSGAYPQTPQTPRGHGKHKESTPISWSPSPLSSRSRSNRKQNKDNLIRYNSPLVELSDDDGLGNDENIPPSRIVVEERHSPQIRKGKGKRRIIDSDDEEVMNQRQSAQTNGDKGKGKQKANEQSSPSIDREVISLDDDDVPFDDDPTPKRSLPASGSKTKNSNGSKNTGQAVGATTVDQVEKDPLDTQYSDFDDFPFDEIDLDTPIPKRPSSLSTKPSSNNAKRTTRRSSPATPTINDIAGLSNNIDLFGPRHADDEMSNRIAIAEAIDEYYIPLIPDLPERWQEFYLNHWRRGADGKSKSKSTSDTVAGGKNKSKSRVIMRNGVELVSESEDEDDAYEDENEDGGAPAKKKRAMAGVKGGRAGPAAKRGKWGWRGAWRGRGRGRGTARKR
ncbi:hypothetical protein IAT40_004840 [Kwoniella sp. CBS 6097]